MRDRAARTQARTLSWLRLGANLPPSAAFTATPESGDAPLSVELSAAASSDPEGGALRFEWDWDGDGTYDSEPSDAASVAHIYESSGEYQTTLRVTDDAGAWAVASVLVQAAGAPTARLSATPAERPGAAERRV